MNLKLPAHFYVIPQIHSAAQCIHRAGRVGFDFIWGSAERTSKEFNINAMN